MVNSRANFAEVECTNKNNNIVLKSDLTCSEDEANSVCVKHSVEGEEGFVHKCVDKNDAKYKDFFAKSGGGEF